MLTITLIGSSTSLAYSIFPGFLKTQSCSELFPLLLPELQRDGTTSKNVGSSSSSDELAALVNRLDTLGRDMKKLKESIHAIWVKCQVCEGHHPDKNCPLNEEVKGIEEVKYEEYGNPLSNHNQQT
ncbi:hypothetical protein Tco_0640475 [Tanacetum coccineum]